MARENDEILDGKSGAVHDEHIVIQEDSETTWECLKANPKIVLWTLWANSSYIPFFLFLYFNFER